MPRRRLILPTLFLLLATFVVAVQHDTFIRRWCLPTPPPATRAAGPLDQVIDEFVVDDAHPADVLRELARRAGARIDAGEAEYLLVEKLRSPRPSCVIRQATIEQLLYRIVVPATPYSEPATIRVDRTLINFAMSTSQKTLRVHDVDPILLRSGLRFAGFPWTWRYHYDPIRTVNLLTYRYFPSGRSETDPVLRFGDKLVVLTTARNHWLIDQYLHEEAEAQHANRNHPAATRPAPVTRQIAQSP